MRTIPPQSAFLISNPLTSRGSRCFHCYRCLQGCHPYRLVNFMVSTWRLLIGLSCVPGAIALYFRLTIPETLRFTMDIERNIEQAVVDIDNAVAGHKKTLDEDASVQGPKATWADFRAHFGQLKNFKILFGTSYSWFAFGVRFCHLIAQPPCSP